MTCAVSGCGRPSTLYIRHQTNLCGCRIAWHAHLCHLHQLAASIKLNRQQGDQQ